MSEAIELTHNSNKRLAAGDVLAIGFATTSAMWAIGYLGRMPAIMAPPWVIAVGLLVCLLAGGVAAGRLGSRGWRSGLVSGLITAALNLMILGSMLRGDEHHPAPHAVYFLPGTFLATAAITSLAAWVGARTRKRHYATSINWTFAFACVTASTTLLLLLAGGLVTGREAGLAVPDWPSSYAYNMFLYPLARMTGNIYYEHTHRLVGALVGLSTIVLAIHICIRERRTWVKTVAVFAVLAVLAQGIMGGLRVTQAAGDATDKTAGVAVASVEHETTVSRVLRVAHGVSGQLFFALAVALCCFVSTAWARTFPTRGLGTSTDRVFTALLLGLMLLQLLLGALLRHLNAGLMLHISVATLVLFQAVGTSMRLWGLYGSVHPPLKRLSGWLLIVVLLQVFLGITALVLRSGTVESVEPSLADVTSTTAHQVTGAVLLGLVTAITCMAHRLLRPPEVSH